MKKNLKKIFALTCVFTMLTSTVAFGDVGSSTGDSGIENDDSTAPAYLQCVLPTITDGTYDFTIDVGRLLPTYDKDDTDGTTWDGSSNVFFSTVGTPAMVTHKTSGKSFYIKSTKMLGTDANTSLTTFYGLFTTTSMTAAEFANLPLKYYVWQPATETAGDPPATTVTGAGKYTLLTADNLATFFEYDVDGSSKITSIALKANYMSGDPATVCNGIVYVDTYAEAATNDLKAKVATYLTIGGTTDSPTYTVNKAGVLYDGDASKTDADAADLSSLALGTDITASVIYADAIINYINTSEKQTIINKSTFPVAVSATVTLAGTSDKDHGLTFSTTNDFSATADKTAAMYMSIVCGTNEKALEDSEAVAYYVLGGAANATYTYQSTEKNDATGSYKYVQYESAEATYSQVDFQVKAIANEKYDETTQVGFDWDKYVDDLTATEATIAKPTVSVVYDFETLGEGETTEKKTTVDAADTYTYTTVYEDENGFAYTVVDPTSYNAQQATPVTTGWATGEEAVTRTMTLASGKVSYTFAADDRPTGTVTSVKVNGTDRIYQYTTGNITYTNGVLTFNSTAISKSGLDATGTHTIVITVGGTDYALTYVKN